MATPGKENTLYHKNKNKIKYNKGNFIKSSAGSLVFGFLSVAIFRIVNVKKKFTAIHKKPKTTPAARRVLPWSRKKAEIANIAIMPIFMALANNSFIFYFHAYADYPDNLFCRQDKT